MASQLAVADKRARAELRLSQAVRAASDAFGVTYKQSATPAGRYPDLAAAEMVENVADFLEQLTAQRKEHDPK